jgi:hypothetical protein
VNETCDRCGPAVQAMYRADRNGELYLCEPATAGTVRSRLDHPAHRQTGARAGRTPAKPAEVRRPTDIHSSSRAGLLGGGGPASPV